MSSSKSKARECAVQALYQWQVSGDSLSRIHDYFIEQEFLKGAQKSYFYDLFHGIPAELDVIDKTLAEFVDRPVEKLDPVERAILRLGTYELIKRLDTPYRVIINEGVELAKAFGAEGSHKYVNGILDKVSQKTRAAEIKARQQKRK
ncbi:transcription antitermination factor NusB [methane-oxidizing endosymbiont of Gigantopelta aegis]|uniref:transcription antitermination factor NusB n=1 Tax=methane-oxidizing endosymbiont of Gigantopelta aegis TaxID=2794938 RepID=UPI0018DEC6A7|nr:transcription antitermination factor NusB [methane-oxidizing endosymbiont of Gigantopelta aegis]